MKTKAAIIIPCFNEQDNIIKVIDDILNNAPANEEWLPIVINDCSTDNTLARLTEDGRATILDLSCNSGVGAGVQTGFKYAWENDFDYVFKFDGDGQHRAECINDLLKPLKNGEADFVVGSRFFNNNHQGFQSTPVRRMGIKFFRILIKLLCGYDSSDPTSGFRGYNRKALKFAKFHYPSFDYPEPEELILMKRNNFRIKDIYAEMRERQGGISSISPFKGIYYMFKVTFAIFMVALRPQEKGF